MYPVFYVLFLHCEAYFVFCRPLSLVRAAAAAGRRRRRRRGPRRRGRNGRTASADGGPTRLRCPAAMRMGGVAGRRMHQPARRALGGRPASSSHGEERTRVSMLGGRPEPTRRRRGRRVGNGTCPHPARRFARPPARPPPPTCPARRSPSSGGTQHALCKILEISFRWPPYFCF